MFPETVALPAAERHLAEQHLQQRRLARPVGAEHGDELARVDGQVEVVPEDTSAEGEAGARQFDRGGFVRRHG